MTDKKLESRLTNLAKAQSARIRKARFKEDLSRMGQVQACRLLAERVVTDPVSIRSFSVRELLMSVDGIGRIKADLMAKAAGRVSLQEKVGHLPDHRRRELARVLGERADQVEGRRVQAA